MRITITTSVAKGKSARIASKSQDVYIFRGKVRRL